MDMGRMVDVILPAVLLFFLAVLAVVCIFLLGVMFDQVVGIDTAWRDVLALVRELGDAWRGSQ